MKDIVIIGAGAAGMMAGVLLGMKGQRVTIYEKNERLGKKLYITGKGRCNFTNDCSRDEFLAAMVSNPRFMYSALDTLDPQGVIALFESWGLRTKVERGRRAFPASDKSADVLDMFRRQLKKNRVEVVLNAEVKDLILEEGRAAGVKVLADGREREVRADAVIVATGGLSYPSTGSTGDGYRFAREAGLKVTATRPSLVSLVCAEEYCKELQGLSLKNVALHIKSGKKEVYSEFGEMLFTHYGITGPLVLTASARVGGLIGEKPLSTWIDLKPAVTEETLDARLVRIFEENKNKTLRNVLGELYPAKMIPVIPALAGVDGEKKVHDVSKKEREALVRVTKHMPLTLTSLRPYNEAVVTQGGVSVKEVAPATMESKKVGDLYFIGEVLDLDAVTGGFNLQIAWSTAAVCAEAILAKEEA